MGFDSLACDPIGEIQESRLLAVPEPRLDERPEHAE
jgi:hypothetical protein